MRVTDVRTGASGATTIVADGGSSFIVDLDLLREFGLDPKSIVAGVELTEEAEAALHSAAEVRKAEARGLALLARSEQSSFMLKTKLLSRGFSESAVCLALERLATAGYLDDERFARSYLRSRLSRRRGREGPASLEAALRRHGIDSALAASSIAAVLDTEERREALNQAAVEALRRSKGDFVAARSRLVRLGFRASEISEVFENLDKDDTFPSEK